MYVSCTSGNKYLRLLSLSLKVYLAGIMGFSVGFRGVFLLLLLVQTTY